MKNLMHNFQVKILIFLSVFALGSCTGPEGPAGKDGNANVTIISLNSSDITWTSGAYNSNFANIFRWKADEVTQDIFDKGAVLGFYSNGNGWFSLPYILNRIGTDIYYYVVYSYLPGEISLYAFSKLGAFEPTQITKYRFLLITDSSVVSKPDTKNGRARTVITQLEEAGVDIDNYYEVCAYFGISPD